MSRATWCVAALATLALAVPSVARADAAPTETEASRARTQAGWILLALEQTSDAVRARLRKARVAHDARAVACLDPTLSRADTALRYGRDHVARAAAAWRAGDVVTARQEMLRLTWRRDASQEAARAADLCLPPDIEIVAREGTTVRVYVDPTLPTDVAGYP